LIAARHGVGMARPRFMSTRAMLRAYQRVREAHADNAHRDDLDFLQAKDLDLSVRLGGLLAFDALLATVAINPIVASPGAPVSLDAPTQPWEVVAVSISVLLFLLSALLCVRAIMLGEEFSDDGIEDDPKAIMQRMFATDCASVDFQARMIRIASRLTIAGGVAMVLSNGWIMIAKM
jgi:hypothetical protein